MSVYLGTTLLAGTATETKYNANNLLDFKWTDHELNDQSWLKADTFSWQDGTVYSDAYSHLVADYSGGTSKTETIGSHTITFVEATDGHRITTDESTVADIYTESGVAWFYVLDTANQRFKLPRSTHGQIVERLTSGSQWAYVYADGWCEQGDAVFGEDINVTFLKEFSSNDYVITYSGGGNLSSGTAQITNSRATTGFYFKNNANGYATNKASWRACGYISSTPNNTPYQRLYFYVGQFSQSATEQTAGLNASLFNGKADIDLSNAASNASSSAKTIIAGWGMPDYSSGVSVSYTELNNGYQAPFDGVLVISFGMSSTVTINGTSFGVSMQNNNHQIREIHLSKNDTIQTTTISSSYAGNNVFFPLKGVQNA